MANNNPWIGLASYEEPQGAKNDRLFCGRDKETLEIFRLIDNNLFTTLYGSSGVGKTSIMRAGVMPFLRRREYAPVYVRLIPKVGTYAFQIVDSLIRGENGLQYKQIIQPEGFDVADRLFLWNFFCTIRFYNQYGREVYPVIILDQFEEIFRNSNPVEASLLLRQIYPLINGEMETPDEEGWSDDTNYRFVASIREDCLFILEDAIDENCLDLLKNNRYRLRPMKHDAAKEVVLRPGKNCISAKEKNSIAKKVITLATKNDSNNEIDPLLLSLICAGTYDRKSGKKIVEKDLSFWGEDPMEKYYSLAVESLPKEAVRYIQLHLIKEDGSRNRVIASEMISQLGESVFNRLCIGENRILKKVEDDKLELLHDQLAKVINDERKAFEERERKEEIEQERNKLCVLQSRLVLEKVKSVVDSDSYLARRLAVEVLPKDMKDPDRPYDPEVDVALRFSSYRNNIVLCGHNNTVYSALFSPDGKRLLSTSFGMIKIWDVEAGITLQTIETSFSGAVFYHDSRHILVLPDSYPNNIEIRDLDTGEIIQHAVSKDFVSHGCVFHNNVVVTSNDSTWIDLRDVSTGAIIKTFYGEEDEYFSQCMSISSDGIMIAAGTDDRIRVWNTITNGSVVLSHGHTDMVYAVAFSPNGKNLVSASWDRTLKIWDIETRQVIMTLRGHTDKIFSVAYSADGKTIVSGSEDNTAIVWDSTTGVALRKFDGHTDAIESVVFSPDCRKIVSSSHDQTIRIWYVAENPELHIVEEAELSVFNPIVISPVCSNVVFSCGNSMILWDINTHSAIRTMGKHTGNINAIAYSPDGNRVVSASADNTIMLWDVGTGNLIRTFIGHTGEVRSVSFSPNQRQVASTSNDQTLKLWDVENGKCLRTIYVDAWMVAYNPTSGQIVFSTMDGKMGIVGSDDNEVKFNPSPIKSIFLSFAISPDGKQIVSLSKEGVLAVWDAKTGNCMDINYEDAIYTLPKNIRTGFVAFDADGKRIVTITGKSLVRIWELVSATLFRRYNHYFDRFISSVVFSPSENAIIYASSENIGFFDVTNELGQSVFQKPCSQLIETAAISPDNSLLAVVYKYNNFSIVRQCKTGTIHRMLIGHEKSINSLAFNTIGNLVVTTSYDNTIRVWSVDSGQEIKCLCGNHEFFYSACFNPYGTSIISISRYNFNSFFKDRRDAWNNILIVGKKAIIMRKTINIELVGHSDVINSALFNSDKKKVVTSSCDNTIIVWDADDGKMIHTLFGHTDSVNYATFSIDGRYIVSASNDHFVKLWDAKNGKLLRTYIGHTEKVIGVYISPDNKKVVSVSADKSFIIWDAQIGEMVKVLNNFVSNEDVSLDEVSVDFSVDGKFIRIYDNDNFLVVASENGEQALKSSIRIWNYENDTIVSSYLDHSDSIKSIQFSKDGKSFVSASNNGTIKIWDSVTCALKKTFENENLVGLKYAMFGAENKTIIAIDEDKNLKVWDVDSGAIIRRVDNISGQYCISPDGRYLVSETDKNTIAIRDMETNTSLQKIKKPQYGYDSMTFSPSGNIILLTKDYSIYLWDFPPLQELIDKTREQFKDNPFTPEERRRYYLE